MIACGVKKISNVSDCQCEIGVKGKCQIYIKSVCMDGLYCLLPYFLAEDIHICLRCVNDRDPFGFKVW